MPQDIIWMIIVLVESIALGWLWQSRKQWIKTCVEAMKALEEVSTEALSSDGALQQIMDTSEAAREKARREYESPGPTF